MIQCTQSLEATSYRMASKEFIRRIGAARLQHGRNARTRYLNFTDASRPFVRGIRALPTADHLRPFATFVTPLPDDHELFRVSPRSLRIRAFAGRLSSPWLRFESLLHPASESIGFSLRAALLGKYDAFCI